MGSGVFCLGRAVGVFEAVYFMEYRGYFLSFITVLGDQSAGFKSCYCTSSFYASSAAAAAAAVI